VKSGLLRNLACSEIWPAPKSGLLRNLACSEGQPSSLMHALACQSTDPPTRHVVKATSSTTTQTCWQSSKDNCLRHALVYTHVASVSPLRITPAPLIPPLFKSFLNGSYRPKVLHPSQRVKNNQKQAFDRAKTFAAAQGVPAWATQRTHGLPPHSR